MGEETCVIDDARYSVAPRRPDRDAPLAYLRTDRREKYALRVSEPLKYITYFTLINEKRKSSVCLAAAKGTQHKRPELNLLLLVD